MSDVDPAYDETGKDEHVAQFAELATVAQGTDRHAELRRELITAYLPVARKIAHRFAHRGEPYEDLEQVAMFGLINAVDRFEPDRGSRFLSFAVPTITGEVRRHFRDRAWSLHLPRRLKDLYLRIRSAADELTQQHGRTPRPSVIAQHLGITTAEVLDGLSAAAAYRSDSLDRTVADSSAMTVQETLGVDDGALDLVEEREAVKPLLARLPEREQTVLILRFFRNMTQAQIADRLGVSQMHVSRMLTRTLDELRDELRQEGPGA